MNTFNQFLTRLLLIGILLSAFSVSVFAQKGKQTPVDESIITEDMVSAEVFKAFKKRFASATETEWRLNKSDSSYNVKMISRGTPVEAIFQSNGEWVGTIEQWDESKLSGAFRKTIDMFYLEYKVCSISKHVIKDQEDVVIVQLYEKQNIKKKLVTTVYLDKSGKFITAEEPDENATAESSAASKKELKEEEKMNKEFDKDRRLDIYPTKLTESELPQTIQRWVRINYPEYLYKSIDFEEFDGFEQHGHVYQIVIQRSGINQPYATVWFTRNGDFLKLEDTFKEKYEEAAAAKEVATPETPVAAVPVPKNIKEVPQNVVDSFNVKFKSAKEVSWEENEDGDWDAFYTDRYGEVIVTYTDVSAQWIQTKSTVADPTKIPSAIRNAILRDYPKSEVVKGWLIKSLGVKNYYIVEIYTKKTKSTEELEYWQTGKPKE